ncbi:MAG: TerC family protein [Ginsengibacter sp.]
MDWILNPEIWASLITLTVLEIVLGIDNIIFISIMAAKLPVNQQQKARQWGLALAMIMRILLLLSLTWIMTLTEPIFDIGNWLNIQDPEWVEKLNLSGRDLILIIGGLFLIYKSTSEMHDKLEGEDHLQKPKGPITFSGVIFQILLLDIVFSLDSVITAVGMAKHIEVMIAAVVISVVVMMISAKSISDFVNKHPTVKMLALAFLLIIGLSLLAEGFEQHIPKGYIYFAMAFSVFVEMMNLRVKSKSEAVHLHNVPVSEEIEDKKEENQ